MAEEIERKFLVAEVPSPERLGPGDGLRQGYLAVDGSVEVRVRLTEPGARLTVKAGAGLSRTEVDLPLGADEATELWPHTAGRRVEKQRHRIDLGADRVAEVDLYDGDLDGLCTVEVEFSDRAGADTFEAPGWFGTELTGRPGWSNAALARDGRPAP
ncbi:MAG: adenylate cyclase [Acidimicrobiales bacterium]